MGRKLLTWEASPHKEGSRIPNRYYMCKEDEETGDYILLHFTKVPNL